MSHYQKLSTTKYYYESVQNELKEVRRQKNRQATQSFFQFLFLIAAMFATFIAIQEMPNWLPTVTTFMDEKGITPILQQWFA